MESNIDIDKMTLLMGKAVPINAFITVKHPTIEEIQDIGEARYYAMIHPFVLTPEDLMVEYADVGIDYQTVDEYHTFCDLMQIAQRQNVDFTWLLGISLKQDEYQFMIDPISQDPIAIDKSSNQIINRLDYYKISRFLKTINNIPLERKYNPGNGAAKKALIKEERKKRSKKKSSDSATAKLVSALAWKNTCGLSILTVWKLHLYQLFDGIHMIAKIDKANNLLHGIYSGVVDSKKINTDELNWLS